MTMSEEEDRQAAVEAEIAEFAKGFDRESWAETVAKGKKREEERRRRLFGDREPFAIPDVEADSGAVRCRAGGQRCDRGVRAGRQPSVQSTRPELIDVR
jgi:hypothetical protein